MSSKKSPNFLPIVTHGIARIPTSVPMDLLLENEHSCAYLQDRTANLPLVLCKRVVSTKATDDALAAGLRRAGVFLYYTACNGCQACEPVRLDVTKFQWSRSWKRILTRGDRLLNTQFASTRLHEDNLRLFNRHRSERNLGDDGAAYGNEDYESFLVESCFEQTQELRFYLDGQLVGVSVIDCGDNSISAVYTYFDPDFSKLSIGTYSILKQIELCRSTNRTYLYLGMYVKENQHLNYKARYKPQQRWVQGSWIDIDK
ncbi:MAG: arginyltransferase [Pirellula sp.]|jgi:arginyl-tRNA--protein-N-Asp/Glu arginylyltransferase